MARDPACALTATAAALYALLCAVLIDGVLSGALLTTCAIAESSLRTSVMLATRLDVAPGHPRGRSGGRPIERRAPRRAVVASR